MNECWSYYALKIYSRTFKFSTIKLQLRFISLICFISNGIAVPVLEEFGQILLGVCRFELISLSQSYYIELFTDCNNLDFDRFINR